MTIKVDETTLLTFLLDWQAWAGSEKALSPAGVRYSVRSGLCACVWEYIWHVYDKHAFDDRAEAEYILRGIMTDRFEVDGLCDAFPFGQKLYYDDCNKGTMHLCPHRLQWVADTIAALTIPEPAAFTGTEPDVWRKEYNVTGMLKLLFIILAAWMVYCLSATFIKAEEFSGGHPVLEVYGCPVMTQDKLECKRELYDIDGTYDDCELIAQSLRTNPGIIKSVCHFQH